jgi:hypothetical protein
MNVQTSKTWLLTQIKSGIRFDWHSVNTAFPRTECENRFQDLGFGKWNLPRSLHHIIWLWKSDEGIEVELTEFSVIQIQKGTDGVSNIRLAFLHIDLQKQWVCLPNLCSIWWHSFVWRITVIKISVRLLFHNTIMQAASGSNLKSWERNCSQGEVERGLNWPVVKLKGNALVTLPRTLTPYRDSMDGTHDHVTYQKLVTR